MVSDRPGVHLSLSANVNDNTLTKPFEMLFENEKMVFPMVTQG